MRLLFLMLLLTSFTLHAQNRYASKEYSISFQTSQQLTPYTPPFENMVGYENENVAVEYEVVPLDQESAAFIKDPKYGAVEIAQDMELQRIGTAKPIPGLPNAGYVLAYDSWDGEQVPVFIAAIIDNKRKVAYEITLDCFNLTVSEGEKIIKSFRIVY